MFQSIKRYLKSESNILMILLIVLNVMFFTYYLLLSFYNRLHFDDYSFLWVIRDKGSIQYFIDVYFGLSGRFIAYAYIWLYTKVILWTGSYTFLPILNWLLGVFLLNLVSVNLFRHVSKLLVINISILFFNIFCLTNIDFPIMYWLCAMSYLLVPIVFLCLINELFFSRGKHNTLLIAIYSIIVGGGLEVFTPTAIVILFLCLVFYFNTTKGSVSTFLSEIKTRNLIISLTIISFSFIIVLLAPGNYLRMDMGAEFVHPSSISQYLIFMLKAVGVYFYFISFYVPYYAVFILLFAIIGINSKKYFCLNSYFKYLIISVVLYALIIFFSVFQNVYLMSGFGLQRTYTHPVFFTILFFSVNGFLIGYFYLKEKYVTLLSRISTVFILGLIVVMLCNLVNDIPVAEKYSRSVDERNELLLKLNKEGNTKLVKLKPLYKPEILDAKYMFLNEIGKKNNQKPLLYYSSEISSDSIGVSLHQKKYFKLNYNIIVDNNK